MIIGLCPDEDYINNYNRNLFNFRDFCVNIL